MVSVLANSLEFLNENRSPSPGLGLTWKKERIYPQENLAILAD